MITIKKLIVLIPFLCVLLYSSSVLAYSVVEDSNGVIKRIDDNGDRYYLIWDTGYSTVKMIAKEYEDSNFTTVISTTEHIAGVNNSYDYYAGVGQLYDTYWSYDLYDNNNNLIGHVKFDSRKEVEDSQPDELVPVMKDIRSILTSQSHVFTDIKQMLGSLDLSIKDLHSEFKTDKKYTVKPLPDQTDKLNQNKPPKPDNAFYDNTQYFKDNGDANVQYDSLPLVPAPTDNWDGITKENELIKQEESERSKELNKDTELQKDEFTKESELTLDEFEKDSEMVTDKFDKDVQMEVDSFEKTPELQPEYFNKSPELVREDYTQDLELEKDIFNKDEFSATEKYNQSHFYEKNHVYKQTNKMEVTQ